MTPAQHANLIESLTSLLKREYLARKGVDRGRFGISKMHSVSRDGVTRMLHIIRGAVICTLTVILVAAGAPGFLSPKIFLGTCGSKRPRYFERWLQI